MSTQVDSTKQRILMAAGPIFAKRGFVSATVRDICDVAEVNLASINYYFGDKQNLYLETVVAARQMRAQSIPDPKWGPETPAEEKLEDYVRLLLKRIGAFDTAPWQVRLLMREILQPTNACRTLVKDYFRPFLDVLMSINDEILGLALSNDRRLQIAFSIVGQCMYYRFAGDVAAMMIEDASLEPDFDIDRLASHITEFSLGALERIRSREDLQSDTRPIFVRRHN